MCLAPGTAGNLPASRIAVAPGCSLGWRSPGLGDGGASWRETGRGSPGGPWPFLELWGVLGMLVLGSWWRLPQAPAWSKPWFMSGSAQGPLGWADIPVRQVASRRGQASQLIAEQMGGWVGVLGRELLPAPPRAPSSLPGGKVGGALGVGGVLEKIKSALVWRGLFRWGSFYKGLTGRC